MIIAIDGPAASGKGTLAQRLADHFKLPHLDTGLLYRAVGWLAGQTGQTPAAAAAYLDAADLDNPALRTDEAGQAASKVAAIPEVRVNLLKFQREFAHQASGAVLDGRDIGTVVFPDADLKIYVTATPEARAERRFLELQGKGETADRVAILGQIRERDRRDTERATSPLTRAPDAILLDTTELGLEEQVVLASRWAALAMKPVRRPTLIYSFGSGFTRFFARWFLDFTIQGLDRVPRKGPLIVACNHISFWDPPLVGAHLPREMHFVAKAELFHNPLFGALIRSYNSIPIQRGAKSRSGLRGAEEVLTAGGAVLIFPEGTRNKSGELLQPRGGVGRLAALTKTPVVPACITGSDQIRRSMRRQVRIRVSFGSPVMPPRSENPERDEVRAFARMIMDRIRAMREEQEAKTWK